MAKRIFALILLLALLVSMAACGGTKIVHCDRCGCEIELSADDKIEEDWIVFCEDCGEPVVEPG